MAINYKYRTSLKSKLSFKNNVAPKDYDSIKERLKLPRGTFSKIINCTPLSNYLLKEEGLEVNVGYGVHDRFRKRREVFIKSNKRKMTLEINVESQETLESNELINMVSLYEFILTGKYPKKDSK